MWCIRSDGRRRAHTVLTRSVLAMEDNTTATRTKHHDVCSRRGYVATLSEECTGIKVADRYTCMYRTAM